MSEFKEFGKNIEEKERIKVKIDEGITPGGISWTVYIPDSVSSEDFEEYIEVDFSESMETSEIEYFMNYFLLSEGQQELINRLNFYKEQ